MFFIKLNKVSKSFSVNKNLIEDLSLTLSEKDILGIIGRNGEGKTTLVKILAGELEPDEGNRELSSKDLKIGYHSQFLQIPENEEVSIENYILKNFPELLEIQNQIQKLSASTKAEDIEKLIELQSKFEELNGYNILSEIDKAMIELGLSDFTPNDSVRNLSGGQKTRLQLAKVMIGDPDILLLDEPTNHLDKDAIKWLENFIKNRGGITVIISHNRSFLNNVANQILEFERGKTKLYTGNYDDYHRQKQELIATNLEEIKQNNRKNAKLQDAVNVKRSQVIQQMHKKPDKKTYGRHARTMLHNRAGKKARQAAQAQKRVNQRVERSESIAPVQYRDMHFKIESMETGGDFVLRIQDLDMGYKDKILVENINFEVKKGERVAIQGENGSGKTTFLKTMIDAFKNNLSNEKIKLGSNIHFAYYSQEHEGIDLDLSVIDDFRKTIPMLEKDAGNYLHNMLFTYEQLQQKVRDLSEGEKSKLVLAKLLAGKHNFLILDEPTNHLDIPSVEVLENAFKEYSGTILVVSHDEYFLQKIDVNRYYKIENKKMILL